MTTHTVGETTFNERLMYKVYTYNTETHTISEILFESRDQAHQVAKLLRENGFYANENKHSWCVLTEC